MRVTVIGGGISGLTAAYWLLEAGHDVTAIDAGLRPGGLVSTERIDGYLCETGPQALIDTAPDTQALIDALGLRDEVVLAAPQAARRLIYLRGRLRSVPLDPMRLLFSPILSLRGKLRLVREPWIARRTYTGLTDDESIYDFATRRLGEEVARDLFATAILGIHAGDARRLSVRAALPGLVALEAEHQSLLRGLRARRGLGLRPGRLISFRTGLETLVRALAATLGTRLLRARALSIHDAAGKWTVDLAPAGPDAPVPRPVPPADHLVLAAGARATADLLQPIAPAAAVNLRQIPFVPAVVVCLGFDRTDIGMDLSAYGFLVACGEIGTRARLLGCQYESSVFPGRAPHNHVLLRTILGGAFCPDVLRHDDATLVEMVLNDLTRLAGLRANPTFTRVFRHGEGIPQYELGHLALTQGVDEALRLHPGLHVLGYALRGIAVNDCIRAAAELARLIA